MKKKLKTILTLLVISTLTVPSFARADWGGWYDGDTVDTWSGNKKATFDFGIISVNGDGRYEYRPENDSFYCFLDSSFDQKPQEFLTIEDSIFGKPVTKIFYVGWDDEIKYSVPSKGLYVSDSVTELDLWAFDRAEFQNIYLSSAITAISKGAFVFCKNLKQIQLPNNLEVIKQLAFITCISLNEVKIPDKVKKIEKNAFKDCKNLTKIYLPISVQKIEKDVFKGCNKLTIYCEKDSYAYEYAKKHKIKTKVLAKKAVKAKQITSLPKTVTVGTHEVYLLFPFVEPFYATNQKLAYISDNPSIAEVNQNGKIDGKKKGTATITVMTTDGSNLQKKIKVTVKQGKTAMNPYFTLYQLKEGTTEFNVDAMLYNRNTKATYQIESRDSSIATAKVEKGILKVTAKKAGNVKFIVTEKYGKTETKIGSFPVSVSM